jgi:preprotein translocase subunit SecG
MKKMILILLGLMFVSTTVLSVGCSHQDDDDSGGAMDDDDDDSA